MAAASGAVWWSEVSISIRTRQQRKRAVASLLVNINAESPRFNLEPIIVQTLVEHYQEKELGDGSNKTFATCETYKGYFRKWILPRWGNYRLKDVKAVAV
jgi:hypothetical protein